MFSGACVSFMAQMVTLSFISWSYEGWNDDTLPFLRDSFTYLASIAGGMMNLGTHLS